VSTLDVVLTLHFKSQPINNDKSTGYGSLWFVNGFRIRAVAIAAARSGVIGT
jgi:hypothetical protein